MNIIQKIPIKRLNLVKRCLKETANLYKISAIIELLIFLTFIIVFLLFYLLETNESVFNFRNQIFKNYIFQENKIVSLANNFTKINDKLRIKKILITSFQYSEILKSVSLF